MKDYIEALREIKKENKDFKITLSRKEVLELVNEFDRLNNITKEIRDTLNNKRTIMTTKLLNGEYCDYEELLYQVDEEIRKILDKENKNE